ncbi:MAG: hypothetical protein NDI88_01655 [Lysobacter sp.]|nr:hypothetical protein [Lysobacter sp.]
MRIAAAVTAFALAAQSCTAAWAACSWEWLCNGEGACRHMPVCDSVYETPPPRPESRPPVAPPLAMRPMRAAGQGRTELSCEYIMRLGKGGRWSWSEACFCTDRTKGPEPSNPFAHIVRCDDPRARDPSGR